MEVRVDEFASHMRVKVVLWHDVAYCQAQHFFRIIECQSARDATTAIVAYDVIFIEAELFASFDDYVLHHDYQEFEYILRQVDGKAVWFVSFCTSAGYITLDEAFEFTVLEE